MKSKKILASLCAFCLSSLCLGMPVHAEETSGQKLTALAQTTAQILFYSLSAQNAVILNQQLAQRVEQVLEEHGTGEGEAAINIRSLDGKIQYDLNGDEEFFAASLYKVPLAVYYYDQINAGELSIEDSLPYYAYMYEEGSVIASEYDMGTMVPLAELLEQVIVNSDNTAGHILYENIGGWTAYKEAIEYLGPQDTVSENYYSDDNITTARFMSDVMIHIASNQDQYTDLIEDMYNSQPDHYLNLNHDYKIPQKYGAYDSVVNGSGFNPDDPVYVITVLTETGYGESLVSDVQEAAWEFFHNIPGCKSVIPETAS